MKAEAIKYRQESIPAGSVPPACQLHMFWWLTLGVSSGVSTHPWDTHQLGTYTLPWYSPLDTYLLSTHSMSTHPLSIHPLDIPTHHWILTTLEGTWEEGYSPPWKGLGTRDTHPPVDTHSKNAVQV